MDGTKDDMEGDEVEWAFIEVKDQAGNLMDLTSAPQSTSDGSKVQIDASHPEILEVSFTIDYKANSNLAKKGDNLTLVLQPVTVLTRFAGQLQPRSPSIKSEVWISKKSTAREWNGRQKPASVRDCPPTMGAYSLQENL